MRVFISHVESAHRQGQERCHEEVFVEDLKSVGSDWMFERGTNVEIRRHFSEETRDAAAHET
jgi:hypothetical protein